MDRTTKVNLGANIAGYCMEGFHNAFYGIFAAFLSSSLFPGMSTDSHQLYGLGEFAFGFVARPVGGLLLGTMGDAYGSHASLVSSTLLLSVPSLILSTIPSSFH